MSLLYSIRLNTYNIRILLSSVPRVILPPSSSPPPPLFTANITTTHSATHMYTVQVVRSGRASTAGLSSAGGARGRGGVFVIFVFSAQRPHWRTAGAQPWRPGASGAVGLRAFSAGRLSCISVPICDMSLLPQHDMHFILLHLCEDARTAAGVGLTRARRTSTLAKQVQHMEPE